MASDNVLDELTLGEGKGFDVEGHLLAVVRSVSSLQRDERGAHAVTLARSYATTVDNLWGAVTNGTRIPRWFMPITGELRLGARYQLEGNAGGVVTPCDRPSHFEITWEFGGDVSWVEVGLSDDAVGHARLTLTHISHVSDHWDTYGPGAVGVGWEMGLVGLALYVKRPNEPKLDEAEFAVSPDGKAFITGSGEAWGNAAVAGGTAPHEAHAAARRTTAFYTGESIDPA